MAPLRLDGYVRVSRIGGRQGEGYIAVPAQREAIKRYAAELSGGIVAWHKDEDYSGGNGATGVSGGARADRSAYARRPVHAQ
jgi:hypothetical protein